MKNTIKYFIKNENLSLKNLLNLGFIFNILYKYKYIHFFVTGSSGVLINLILTWYFTEFIFGIEKYFYGYLIGLSANIIWNFIIHTQVNFNTKDKYFKRLFQFVLYTLLLGFIQVKIVNYIVPIIGLEFYLLIIGSVILMFSIVTFIIFKLWIFRK